MKKILNNNIFIIITICVLLTGLYICLLYFLEKPSLKLNEFGDYVGGILNPLFALLSAFSVIYLTLKLSKIENNKADEAIQTQKRLTINQLRHETLNALTEKLNLFVPEIGNFHIAKEGSFKLANKIMVQELKEKRKKEGTRALNFWYITLFELESFLNKKYLFEKLYDKEKFKEKFKSLYDITTNLIDEYNTDEMIKMETLSRFIENQQELTDEIGNFILEEF